MSPELKEALSRWPSGVAVMAARNFDTGKVRAVTVSSFIAVSAEPPLVLAAVNKVSRLSSELVLNGPVVINLLAHDQRRVAEQFAGKRKGRRLKLPHIPGSTATLTGHVVDLYHAGDHVLAITYVDEVELGEGKTPLAYAHRRFTRLEEEA